MANPENAVNVAKKLAEYALSLSYDKLPEKTIHEAKRALLDTMGVTRAAKGADAVQIMWKVLDSFKIEGTSTIIGSGKKTLPQYAALANGCMTRYWDYNDGYGYPMGKMVAASHPSEIIPICLALGESEKISGKELIVSIVLGYEISGRILRSIEKKSLEARGWNMDTRGSFVSPLVCGRIMNLEVEQMENALGIAGSRDMILGILDTAGEVNTMAKNIRHAYTGHNGILAAMLAKEGFTGPVRVLEGEKGFNETVLQGDMNFDTLIDGLGHFIIDDAEYKPVVASRTASGHIFASLENAKKNNINPADIERVDIYASTRVSEHTGNPSKKYPYNKESADHSIYFLTAVALTDRMVGLGQYSQEKYNDPAIKELIGKVVVHADPETFDLHHKAGGRSVVTMKDGTVYDTTVLEPVGDNTTNPMTDQQMEEKFFDCACRVMSRQQAETIRDAIWNIDSCEDIGEFMKLLTF